MLRGVAARGVEEQRWGLVGWAGGGGGGGGGWGWGVGGECGCASLFLPKVFSLLSYPNPNSLISYHSPN